MTHYDATANMWITRVPVGFTSTSDIFVTGAIINSSNGFIKLNGNTNSVVTGEFYSNKTFSDQWAYAMAAYQLPAGSPTTYVVYDMIDAPGDIVPINGTYRAGTPVPIIQYLVQGASGGGGNNYTGSKSSFDNYTACIEISPSRAPVTTGPVTMESENISPVEDLKKGAISVYPNPASNQLTISIQNTEQSNTRIELYSFGGTKLLERNIGLLQKGAASLTTLDLQKFPAGTYLLRIHNGNRVTNKKIVISR